MPSNEYSTSLTCNEFHSIFGSLLRIQLKTTRCTHQERASVQILSLVNFLRSKINAQKDDGRCDRVQIQFEALQVQQCSTEGERLFGFTKQKRLFQQFAVFGIPFHALVSYVDVVLINVFD